MKITKEVIRIDEDIIDIICNKCSKSMKKYSFHGLIEASTEHNWGSAFHTDQFIFSLCEKCVIDLMLTFEIAPTYFTCIPDNSINEESEPVFERLKRYKEILNGKN